MWDESTDRPTGSLEIPSEFKRALAKHNKAKMFFDRLFHDFRIRILVTESIAVRVGKRSLVGGTPAAPFAIEIPRVSTTLFPHDAPLHKTYVASEASTRFSARKSAKRLSGHSQTL